MQKQKRLLGFKKLFSLSLPKLQRHRKKNTNRTKRTVLREDDSRLEAKHRRRFTRGSFDQRRRRVWDETKVSEGMEKLLRPTSREKEIERVREQQEKIKERNLQLLEITKRPGFNVLMDFWNKIETGAYANLRHPENRIEGMSFDSFIGHQNGLIECVEISRKMFIDAAIQHEKDQLKLFKEEEKKS